MPVGADRMKPGVFGSNVDRDRAITTAPARLRGDDRAGDLEGAKAADRTGFEAPTPVGRRCGFGGGNNFDGVRFETDTRAAGEGRRRVEPAGA